MWELLNSWARAHRNARGLAAAIAIWAMLGIALVMKCQSDKDPFLHRSEAHGTVIQVIEEFHGENKQIRWYGIIQLPDSTTVQLRLPIPPPDEGARVPIWAEHYESGRIVWGFDGRKWLIMGPG